MINLKRAVGGFLLSCVFLLFFVYMIAGVQWVFNNSFSNQNKAALSDSVSNIQQSFAPKNTIKNTAPPIINAKSVISVENDLQDVNNILFEKDSNLQLPIASLTKLMTAVIVLDNYNLFDTWQVDEAADLQDPMKEDVKLGDTLIVESFLNIMLVGSSNKSAYALSELIGKDKFVGLMNQKAKDIGLENTFFVDPTGLSPKNVSTVGDLVMLAEHILKDYPKIADTSKAKKLYVSGFGYISNTNELLNKIPEVVCGKTGFTIEANGCLLLVLNNPKNNNYLINVILGADNRFSEMEKLINWSSSMFK